MKFLVPLVALACTVLADSRTSAPSGSIIVGSSSSADYSSVQDAVDSLSTSSSTTQKIFIESGTYTEQVVIPSRKAQLYIYGYTADDSSYSGNKVTITHSSSLLSGAADDDATGTVRVQSGTKVHIYNINIVNSYGKGSQAIALSAYGSYLGCYGCQLKGYQDTLLAQNGYQVYAGCYIEGAVDFIFGQHARIWIDNTVIRLVGNGAVTANGRSSSSDTSYYVINKSSIAASSSGSATSGKCYLGRPWSKYARVVVQKTVLSNVINSAGWEVWSSSTSNTDYVLFGEYGNTGAGATGTRASFATALSTAVSISTILGSSYADWVDTSYLASS